MLQLSSNGWTTACGEKIMCKIVYNGNQTVANIKVVNITVADITVANIPAKQGSTLMCATATSPSRTLSLDSRRYALNYRDMEIEISEHLAGDSFRVHVLGSPAGAMADDQAETVQLPGAGSAPPGEKDRAFANLVRQLRRRRASQDEMLELGAHLADLLLPGRVGELFQSALDGLSPGEEGLRLRLRFTTPALDDLPWELLSWPSSAGGPAGREFLALKPGISICRAVDPDPGSWEAKTDAKIRLALILASPFGLTNLDPDQEAKTILSALNAVDETGEVLEITSLGSLTTDGATRRTVPGAVASAHILHFAGIGQRGPGGDGQLMLEDDAGDPDALEASDLAGWLSNARLAFLGAWGAGREASSDPWAASARTLIRRNVPAVVALADTMRPQNVAAFAAVFYARLLAGETVDEAVAQGRRLVFSQQQNQPERDWSTPILYLGDDAGPLFPLPVTTGGGEQAQAVLRVRQRIGTLSQSDAIALKAQDLLAGDVDVTQIIEEVKDGSKAVAVQLGTIGGRSRSPAPPDTSAARGRGQAYALPKLAEIGERIAAAFTKEELNTLCTDLGINYEEVPGETLPARANELVFYCQRRGRVEDLLARLRRERPGMSWDV